MRPNGIIRDSVIFRLHYKLTTGIFLACFLFNTVLQFSGNSIQCMDGDWKTTYTDMMNFHCLTTGTFTLPKKQGKEAMYPGVAPTESGEEMRYHHYYRCVYLYLFVQGLMFFIPHLIWAFIDRRFKIADYCSFLQPPVSAQAEKAAKNFLSKVNDSDWYARGYLIAHILNVINVIGNIYFIDRYLGKVFLSYGMDVIKFLAAEDTVDMVNPALLVFPRVSKCVFHMYGSSGRIENYDFLCTLTMNVCNDKIYFILWLWLMILSIATTVEVFVEMLLFFVPWLRIRTAKIFFPSRAVTTTQKLTQGLGYGDYFLLRAVAKNTDDHTFAEFVKELHLSIRERIARPSSGALVKLV